MNNFNKLFNKLKSEIKEISIEEVLNRKDDLVIIDIREKDELNEGFLEQSINIPRSFLEIDIEKNINDYSKEIVLYCSSGTRSTLSIQTLNNLGYLNTYSMKGGFKEWKENNYPFIKYKNILSQEQKQRYNRQIILPEIGIEGQEKLLNSKILLVGAGGLSSPIAYYLTAAGIGTIGIIDDDIIDISNLHRQILYNTENIGLFKVDIAKERLNLINQDIKIITYKEKLNINNAENIISNYDLIIDGSDNFACKYLINDFCYKLNKPFIYGSIFKFEGQVSVFNPKNKNKPCYRCLFPNKAPQELIPNCKDVGVIGALAGIIGTIQSIEAIKIILNKGETLSGLLFNYDALNNNFDIFKIKKNNRCEICL